MIYLDRLCSSVLTLNTVVGKREIAKTVAKCKPIAQEPSDQRALGAKSDDEVG